MSPSESWYLDKIAAILSPNATRCLSVVDAFRIDGYDYSYLSSITLLRHDQGPDKVEAVFGGLTARFEKLRLDRLYHLLSLHYVAVLFLIDMPEILYDSIGHCSLIQKYKRTDQKEGLLEGEHEASSFDSAQGDDV